MEIALSQKTLPTVFVVEPGVWESFGKAAVADVLTSGLHALNKSKKAQANISDKRSLAGPKNPRRVEEKRIAEEITELMIKGLPGQSENSKTSKALPMIRIRRS